MSGFISGRFLLLFGLLPASVWAGSITDSSPSQVIGALWVPESADCVRCEMRSFRLNALNKSTAEEVPAEEVDRLNPENMWSLT